MHKPLLRWISPTLIGVMLSGPAFAGAAIARTPTTPSTSQSTSSDPGTRTSRPTSTSTSAVSSDGATYQARETAAAGLERWAGGAGLSITLGGSALALVVLLLVLLIIF